MDYSLFRGWGFIVVGALAIGTGGVFTTLGWSVISERTQINNLIRGVVREYEINESLRSEMLSAGLSTPDFYKFRLYARFKTTALSSLLRSGLLKSSSKKNKVFLKNIADYEVAINEANYRLDYGDRSIPSDTDLDTIINNRKDIYSTEGFRAFVRLQYRFKEILEQNYNWVREMWNQSLVISRSSQVAY